MLKLYLTILTCHLKYYIVNSICRIHNLLHLCSHVRTYGPLDNFSAFYFENCLASIKKRLRKNEKPLAQLIKRYKKIENCNSFLSKHYNNNETLYSYKYLHNNSPVFIDNYDIQLQYLMMSNGNFNIHSNNNTIVIIVVFKKRSICFNFEYSTKKK